MALKPSADRQATIASATVLPHSTPWAIADPSSSSPMDWSDEANAASSDELWEGNSLTSAWCAALAAAACGEASSGAAGGT